MIDRSARAEGQIYLEIIRLQECESWIMQEIETENRLGKRREIIIRRSPRARQLSDRR